ncbi:MAG: DNA-3-methyladenine glycosylase [Candidatus Saccharibacteria bacterium]|nr:DNA-3-methyladenine glycosylase [Candidatus Saccharibacteria bacterium]
MTADQLKEAEDYLRKADPLLGALIDSQILRDRTDRHDYDYFASLARSIIGQQVSVAAANAIYGRFQDQTNLQPENVVGIDEEMMKLIGLSRQKTTYLKDLAQHFVDDPAVYNHLESQTDEQVIAELTSVRGIGIWTAQMFLMFTLNRPDVFAPDDVGLQNGMMKLFGWDVMPKKAELAVIAERWKPYRTVASFHVWQSLENTPA